MRTKRCNPCALTVAGSDSGGGAGVQADLKTFAAYGVHGVSALTCLTAQSPRGVMGVQPTRAGMVRRQIEAVWGELRPGAAKTGMLFSAAIIREVAAFAAAAGRVPWVIDPVMVATSGAPLLQPAAMGVLRKRLLPLATLITPNLDELRLLTGLRVRGLEELRAAARALQSYFGVAVLAKGGHLNGPRAVDVFWDGEEEMILEVPRVKVASTHGTGCTYSAAITAGLARGWDLRGAVREAKGHITEAIRGSWKVGEHWVLGAVDRGRKSAATR